MDVTRDNSQIKCTDLKKCGEIATLLSIGKSAFFLNCGFCEYTFLQLDNFIQHIYEDHKSEFSRLEIKQEEFDMAEALEDGDAAMQTLDATEGNEYNSELNTFERVEIEFDTIEPEIKEENDDEYEDFFEEHKTPGKSKALLKNTGSKQHSPKTKINKTDEAVQDDANTRRVSEDPDFSVDMDATKTDSDMDYEKEMESMFQCGLNESQGTSMDEEDDYREEDNSPISESISKRKVVNKKIPESNQTKVAGKKKRMEETFKIISMFRQHDLLWNPSSYAYRHDEQRKKALQEIGKECGLSEECVKKKLKSLRSTYLIEKKKMEQSESYQPALVWFNEMSFLDSTITSRKSKEDESVYEPDPKLKEVLSAGDHTLDDIQSTILAELYKQYSCLWDEMDIAYRFKNRREEALQSLNKEFNKKTDLNLTKSDIHCEITRLRKFASLEKKEKIMCERQKFKYQPTCPYYNSIEFLEVDVPPFECTICHKLLIGLGQYKVHIATHDGSLPFKCHVCDHGFQLASNLTVHLRRHVHDYTYKCEVCGKPCATTTEIKIHMRTHTGEKPFVCYICGHKASTSSHLLIHVLRHQNRPRHKCKLCSRMFYETGQLNEHMSIHRNIRDQICDICHKGFTSRGQLRQHMLIHNTEKRYSCKICKKRFAQFAGLSCHMKSHGTKL